MCATSRVDGSFSLIEGCASHTLAHTTRAASKSGGVETSGVYACHIACVPLPPFRPVFRFAEPFQDELTDAVLVNRYLGTQSGKGLRHSCSVTATHLSSGSVSGETGSGSGAGTGTAGNSEAHADTFPE